MKLNGAVLRGRANAGRMPRRGIWIRRRESRHGRLPDSDVARDRSALRGRVAAEVDHRLVDVAPAPTFGRVVALDDRMTRGVIVPGGVAVRRAVAAADVTTRPAEPQV